MPRLGIYDTIFGVISRIPKGQVATYGQIAKIAGIPGHARQVGYALHRLPDGSNVPWHRVINAKGQVSLSPHDVSSSIQKSLLKKEGIRLSEKDRISLKKYGWQVDE